MQTWRVAVIVLPALLAGSVAGLWMSRRGQPPREPSSEPKAAPAATDIPPGSDPDDRAPFTLRIPSGEPSSLTCEAARSVIAQVRGNLAYDPEPLTAHALATGTADWLDPHGLWSAASDSPIEAVIEREGAPLLRDLEGETGGLCGAALRIGRALVPWTLELARVFDRERDLAKAAPKPDDPEELERAAEESPFEDEAAARSARELAAVLGQRVGTLDRVVGASMEPYATAARARFFPPLDAEGWKKVVLAAAVRAYVQLLDPHGAWAPADEEASVYEMDLEAPVPGRLWERASRTAIGARVETDPAPPLRVGDIVLSVSGLVTAGLPLEQIEQLGYAAAESDGPITAVILRPGEESLREIHIGSGADEAHELVLPEPGLPSVRVPYGAGDALVVTIHDVRDDLGGELASAIHDERDHDTRPIEGIVIDLRGNGGGSTEGAIAALGLFMPGAPLFPMKRRDGSIQTDRAPEPRDLERWTGPVATLVDGDTASAAEMIAGALSVYHRAPSVGSLTYGKGCAQEYLDDEAETGILRLTTLLYALPDGSPVQRVGIAPSLLIGWGDGTPTPPEDVEREASLARAPPTWRGPDVRDRAIMAESETIVWPQHGGSVGPCADPDVCKALRALGAASKRAPIAKGGGQAPARAPGSTR